MKIPNKNPKGYSQEKPINFLEVEYEPKLIAKDLRRLSIEMIKIILSVDEDNSTINKEWLYNGFYILDLLAEILDPNISIDELS